MNKVAQLPAQLRLKAAEKLRQLKNDDQPCKKRETSFNDSKMNTIPAEKKVKKQLLPLKR